MIHYKDECLTEISSQVKLIREISRSIHNYHLGLKKSPLKSTKRKWHATEQIRYWLKKYKYKEIKDLSGGPHLPLRYNKLNNFLCLKSCLTDFKTKVLKWRLNWQHRNTLGTFLDTYLLQHWWNKEKVTKFSIPKKKGIGQVEQVVLTPKSIKTYQLRICERKLDQSFAKSKELQLLFFSPYVQVPSLWHDWMMDYPDQYKRFKLN